MKTSSSLHSYAASVGGSCSQTGALRYSDHGGLDPNEITVAGSDLTGTPTRSKTLGRDKKLGSRPIMVYSSCHVVQSGWITKGLSMFREMANLPLAILNRLLYFVLQFDAILPCSCRFQDAALWKGIFPSSTAALRRP